MASLKAFALSQFIVSEMRTNKRVGAEMSDFSFTGKLVLLENIPSHTHTHARSLSRLLSQEDSSEIKRKYYKHNDFFFFSI